MKNRNQPAGLMRILSEDSGVYEQELSFASRFLKPQKRLTRHDTAKTGAIAGRGIAGPVSTPRAGR